MTVFLTDSHENCLVRFVEVKFQMAQVYNNLELRGICLVQIRLKGKSSI